MTIASPAPRVLADLVPGRLARNIALVVGGAAFVGIAAQISIPLPFTPVPVTAQTFAVVLVGASLGAMRGMLSMAVYAALGLVGVPWFAEAKHGLGLPSFGYILGFIVAAWVVGRLAEAGWSRTPLKTATAMLIGSAIISVIGVVYLKLAIDVTWAKALALGFTPFVIGDLIKIVIAAGLFPLAWKLVGKVEGE